MSATGASNDIPTSSHFKLAFAAYCDRPMQFEYHMEGREMSLMCQYMYEDVSGVQRSVSL